MPTMLKPILQLTDVSKDYTAGDQRVPVLRHIHLTLHAGAMVAIVGASGSGKSTLLNILGCLDRPSSGTYTVAGRDTRTLDSDELAELRRRYFGFVFQRYHLLPLLSALKNVEMPAIYARTTSSERHARALGLLNRLGLAERAEHRPSQLSGGEQQRVSVARALVNGSKVILADEPTGALDSASGREMMAILLELQAQGHTVIVVTHDRDVAAHAERIIELSDGMIVADRPNPRNAPSPPVVALAAGAGGASREAPRAGLLGSLVEAFNTVRLEMTSHRLRNALAMLGIVIGVASVVAIMAVGEGAQRHMQETIGSLTSRLVEIHRGSDWGDSQASAIRTLLPGDLDALREQRYVAGVTPLTRASLTVRFRSAHVTALVSGVGEGFFKVRNVALATGRAFGVDDIRRQSPVAVIDQQARRKLFAATEDPIGKVIIVGNVPCTVIGVTASASPESFREQELNVLIPYTTAGVRLFGQQHFESITVRLAEHEDGHLAEKSITRVLSYKHGAKDFFINNKDALANAYDKSRRSLSLTLSLIGSIALLVGGIGVMNIMLVSVAERTREIGIRMAVGARRLDILKQFLTQSVVLCLIGGVFGVLLALASSYLYTGFVKEARMVFTAGAVATAVLCSTVVGVLFGFLPARQASLLSPNEALSRD
jgi:macrolide transport system ATP-binding/permease protein